MSDMTVIAQYSFPMNTESVTHGFRRHKIFPDAFASCPPIAGLCPESDFESNIQMVAIINASDERLIGSHCLRPNLDWRCKINAVRHDLVGQCVLEMKNQTTTYHVAGRGSWEYVHSLVVM